MRALAFFTGIVVACLSPTLMGTPVPWPEAGRVYFSGEIKVGAIEVEKGSHVTLSQAVILDGGCTGLANQRSVYIVRANVGKIPVDLADIMEGHLEKDVELRDGDIVVVPPRLVDLPQKPIKQ